jgi:hypothetical protein
MPDRPTSDAAGKPRKKWVPKPLPPVEPGTVRLLTGGNPQIPKGDGEGPVQAYIAAMPGWKSDVGRRIDRLVMAVCPGARKAVRWNAPFWGIEGQGWMLSLGCVTRYVKVCFLRGAELDPPPPVASKHARVRYLHIFEDGAFDETQFADWLRQAARIRGDEIF